MSIRVLTIFYRFYIEWTFTAFVLVILHLLSSQQMPLLPAMAIAAGGSLTFSSLLEKKEKLAKVLFFVIIMPVLYLAGIWAGLKLFYITIMAVLVFWRVMKFHQDTASNSQSVWLLLTFLIGLFLSPLAYFHGTVYLGQMAFLMIFQLLFILLGQFLLRWLEVELAAKSKFALVYSKLFGAIVIAVVLITFGRNFLKEAFFFILQGIGLILSFLLYPFFAWIGSPAMQERAGRVFSRQKPNIQEESEFVASRQMFDADFWGPIMFVAIGVLVFYLIYRKSSLFRKKDEPKAAFAGYITSGLPDNLVNPKHVFNKRSPVPEHQIRKEIFKLEKFAHKKEFGRLSHEGIDEWFNRLGIKYDERTVEAYEKVRYGEMKEVSAEGWFIEEIKHIKNQLHSLRKEGKEYGLKKNLKKFLKD
ncbi:hypothetical protein [Mesobacillus subterraneus]|uniref:DUF4129 domain-containing protein n=1 Tax=Mesobacillus subterraneus TaxID=285983 RepID=A0A3R9FHM5_9BACI|nr:hypothetical protein [Mesobacillus subterraneus]RSD28210.1 hypothetical protein EJA10_07090 [Mesobacillus subterraneus]